MYLCLSTPEDHKLGKVTWEIPFDPVFNRTGDTWHLSLTNLDRTLLYGRPDEVQQLDQPMLSV